jgi:RNA polymerase subunit RPABC4/transcription elongation factor Spt4
VYKAVVPLASLRGRLKVTCPSTVSSAKSKNAEDLFVLLLDQEKSGYADSLHLNKKTSKSLKVAIVRWSFHTTVMIAKL